MSGLNSDEIVLADNAATEATLSSLNSKVTTVNTGAVTVTSSVLPSGASTSANQVIEQTRIGDLTETSPATDTASSGLNGRLQRIAQRITSMISALSDGTQRTRVTDGTNNAALTNSEPVNTAIGLVVRNIPKIRQTYSATAVNIAPAATATDVFTITGSATKTVYIHKITVTGNRTAHAHDLVQIVKRSTANTGGTSAVQPAVPHDSTNAAATATVRSYTANPTLGTAVGTMYSRRVSFPVQTPSNAQGNGGSVVPWEWEYSEIGQPIVLRGTAEQISVNLNSITITGGILQFSIEWSEE